MVPVGVAVPTGRVGQVRRLGCPGWCWCFCWAQAYAVGSLGPEALCLSCKPTERGAGMQLCSLSPPLSKGGGPVREREAP